jgi:hypothetical protein
MEENQLVLVLGDAEIPGAVRSANIRPAGPDGEGVDSAEVVVSTAALMAVIPDYQARAQLFKRTATERHLEFTGIVDAVTPKGDVTTIKLITGLQLLRETGIGGLGMDEDTVSIEAAWSLLRLWGIDADQINIEGFSSGPIESFEVATSLDGLELVEPVDFGGVLLLPSGVWSRLADGLGPKELWASFAEAEAWALTFVQARTWYEAETEGLKAIDVALAWLAIRANYSTAVLPSSQPRRYRRAWTQSRVTRRDVVVVKRSSTGARWLRAPHDIASQPALELSEMEDLQSVVPLPPAMSLSMQEALIAWRRAAESDDPFAAVVALWEAVEWYTSGIKVGPLFSKVEAALKADAVPHTADEIAVLRRVRKIRNDLIHGTSREAPSAADLTYAIAIVARMLVRRIHRIGSEAPSAARISPR